MGGSHTGVASVNENKNKNTLNLSGFGHHARRSPTIATTHYIEGLNHALGICTLEGCEPLVR